MSNPKVQSLQFDFTPDAAERLHRLREKTGAKDNAEVLQRALEQYDKLITEYGAGAEVMIEMNGQRQILKLSDDLAEVLPFPKKPKC